MTIHVDPSTITWQVTPDMLSVLDETGVFKDVNYAWFTTLGRMPVEIENRQFFEFVHPDDMDRTSQAFERIKQGKPVLRFENRYRHKNGSYRWLSWNAVPENGLFVCNARDVTQEKENAATLKTREDEARLREQFVGVLGHDLRNPIAAIDAALSLLAMEPQSDQSREMIGWGQEAVHSSGGRSIEVDEAGGGRFAAQKLGSFQWRWGGHQSESIYKERLPLE